MTFLGFCCLDSQHNSRMFKLWNFNLSFVRCAVTAVLFEDAVILGAACDALTYSVTSPGNTHDYEMPFCTLERTVSFSIHTPFLLTQMVHSFQEFSVMVFLWFS